MAMKLKEGRVDFDFDFLILSTRRIISVAHVIAPCHFMYAFMIVYLTESPHRSC